MPRTRIKICGITRPQDALAAAMAGADAIGMVFYAKARRCISIDTAKEILRILPPFVTPVGLFVDQPLDEIRQTAGALHLRHLQLHGQESPQTVAALSDFTILKAIRADRATLQNELNQWRESIRSLSLTHLQGLVLETPSTAPGGTGIENDWSLIAELKSRGHFTGLPAIIAAGGLTPDNVATVIARLGPYVVDVSSGVEESFGQKSETKIRDFIIAVEQSAV